jgi:hypothetical protein
LKYALRPRIRPVKLLNKATPEKKLISVANLKKDIIVSGFIR